MTTNLTLTMTLNRDCVCPMCNFLVDQKSVTFILGVAFCGECTFAASPGTLWTTIEIILSQVRATHLTWYRGMTLFTPNPKPKVSLRELAIENNRHYIMPPTTGYSVFDSVINAITQKKTYEARYQETSIDNARNQAAKSRTAPTTVVG